MHKNGTKTCKLDNKWCYIVMAQSIDFTTSCICLFLFYYPLKKLNNLINEENVGSPENDQLEQVMTKNAILAYKRILFLF